MLWALLLAGGGLLVAGPVGAIIGLLIGIVLAIVSSGNNTRRLERQIRALQQGGEQASVPPAEQTLWTPSNIAILIIAVAVGFIANEAKKEGPTTAKPAVTMATAVPTGDIYIPQVDTAADMAPRAAADSDSALSPYSAAAADAARAAEAAIRSGDVVQPTDVMEVAEPAIRTPTD